MTIKSTALLIAFTLAVLTGCTTTAPLPWDHPVILDDEGSPAVKAVVEACIAKAKAAGLTPMTGDQKNQEYRNVVLRCVRDKGFVPIGWN